MALAQLSQQDFQQIEAAVAQAEQQTGGEIVPVLAESADDYEAAIWRAGAAAMVAMAICLWLVYASGDVLLFLPPYLWLLIVLAAGSAAMALAAGSGAVKRAFVSRRQMRERVLAQAKVAFHDHGVHCTEQHTGVLIFVSFFERQAVVLADVGIAELVPDSAWQGIVEHLVAGLREGRIAAALSRAVAECGELLAGSGIQAPVNNDNELDNAIRIHR